MHEITNEKAVWKMKLSTNILRFVLCFTPLIVVLSFLVYMDIMNINYDSFNMKYDITAIAQQPQHLETHKVFILSYSR